MDANVVCDPSLRDGNNRSANDGGDEQTRAVPCEWSKFREAKSEYGREHDRVEAAYEDDAPHSNVPTGKHGSGYEDHSSEGKRSKQCARLDLLQNKGADKTASHGAA